MYRKEVTNEILFWAKLFSAAKCCQHPCQALTHFIIVINEILIIVINSLLMNISLKMTETNQGLGI